MQNLFFSILGFLIAISILVTIHEYGHYLAARICGVKVLRFSIGFGKKLYSKISGSDNTEYVLALIPLGGYVKMLDEAEGKVHANEKSRAFNNQPLYQRAFIVFAGPLANFIFAILAYCVVNMLSQQDMNAVVEYVVPDSYAEQAGFKVGDNIIAIDGRDHKGWSDNRIYLFNRALSQSTVNFDVQTLDGQIKQRQIDLKILNDWQVSQALLESRLGLYPIHPQIDAVIDQVLKSGAADKSGLRSNDQIIQIDEQPILSWQQLVEYISSRPGKLVQILVLRDASELQFDVLVEAKLIDDQSIGRIGVSVKPPVLDEGQLIDISKPFFASFVTAIDTTWQMSWLSLRMLWRMLKLEISPDNLSGPIAIAQYAGQTVQVGIDRFISFLAIISISLGIINLMPIPILDGGHLLMYLVEAIKGSPPSEKMLLIGQKLGLLILGALMFFAFYNDLSRLFN